MQIKDIIINENASVLEAMRMLDTTGLSVLFIAPDLKLKAVITDGDIRRFILQGGNIKNDVKKIANYSPKYLEIEMRSEAKALLLKHTISAVPLLDKEGKIADVVFANSLDIDTSKKANLPCVIMAGGLGTRLYPYTKILPKPLIPVGELPIVEHIMNRFIDVGCNDFHMIVNYKKNMIKSYFNDIEKQYELSYTDEDTPLGTGGGLSLLKGKIHKTFFLTNCDILIDADFADVYKHHKENNNLITMVCAVKNFTIPYGVIELDDKGCISKVTEKPEMNFLTNTGVYIVEPRVVNEMEDGKHIGFPDIIDAYRKSGDRVGVYPVSEQSWMDMGQMEELDNMRRKLEEKGTL